MIKKKIAVFTALMLLTSAVIGITGCGSSSTSGSKKDYTSSLKDGVIYVRTAGTNDCNPVYFGNATFSKGSIRTSADTSRIMWFKTDFEKIPTLYEGDSLILYTASSFDEQMTFERFYDVGYTIGLCGMTELKSGRYAISTSTDDGCTYPDGDTDELLKLSNDTVTLDTIGGINIRKSGKANADSESFLSNYGTLLGLSQDKTYAVTVYDGTVKHEYNFTADVRVLGSYEVEQTYDYEFESEKLINITIPKDFNSGYYMINGLGIFRYVAGTSYTENTDFNIANETSASSTSTSTYSGTSGTTVANSSNSLSSGNITSSSNLSSASITSTGSDSSTSTTYTNKFTVTTAGYITVKATFTNADGSSSSTPMNATLTTPTNNTVNLFWDVDSLALSRTLNAMKGEYTVTYYDLDGKIPHLTVTAVEN